MKYKKLLNSIKNKVNYKSESVGISSGKLANFANLRGCNLARDLLFQILFFRPSVYWPRLY